MATGTRKIHRQLILRLFIGCLLLAPVIGGIVYFIETEQADRFVVDLAIEEVEFYKEDIPYLKRKDEETRVFLKTKITERIAAGHFVIVELYNREKEQVVEVTSEKGEIVEETLDLFMHAFMLEEKANHKKFKIDKKHFLMVVVPLRDETGSIGGYFEGVYEVDAKTIRTIYNYLFFSTGMVILVVFITTLLLYPIILALNRDLFRYADRLLSSNLGMIEVLGNAIAKRDRGTNAHNFRVTLLSIRLGEACGLKTAEMQELIKGAFLHDVGKIGISDNILLKQGRLTDEEQQTMKSHVRYGLEIIGKYQWLESATDVVNYHHERYDGSGYMEGLVGEDIPKNARIFTIVDVFEALSSKRPYKEALSLEETMLIMERESGIHFDPVIFSIFKKLAPDLYVEISRVSMEELQQKLDKVIRKYFYI